jgi:hypothetical protein
MYARTLHEFQAKEIDRIGALVARGMDTADLIGSRDANKLFAHRARLKSRLLGILGEIGNFGKTQVKAEIARQG